MSYLEKEIDHLRSNVIESINKKIDAINEKIALESSKLSQMVIVWGLNIIFLGFILYRVYDIKK